MVNTAIPKRGQVWQAHASALLPVLLAGLPYARPEAAMAMKEEILEIIGDGQPTNLPRRPCLILAGDPAEGTFDVVVFTTLKGGRVQFFELHEHFKHWLVPVGHATPSPRVGDFVLETEPAWSATPQWAVACVARLHRRQLIVRWKDNDRAVVSCSKTMVDNLLVNVQYRMRTYSSRSPQQCLAWDHSYLAHRERRILLSLARPSPSSPQQQLAPARPRPAPSHGRSYSAPAALQAHALGAYPAELQQQLLVHAYVGFCQWAALSRGPIASPLSLPWSHAPMVPDHRTGYPSAHYPAFAPAGLARGHGRSHSAPASIPFYPAPPFAQARALAHHAVLPGGGMQGVACAVPNNHLPHPYLGPPPPFHGSRL